MMQINLAIQAACAGGAVLMEKFGTNLVVTHKGDVDLVTEADRAAEAVIVDLFQHHCPDYDILAEEADYNRQHREFCWIIDPLDGTTNYAHGFPWFAVSIALEYNGEVVAGVIFNPCSGEMFTATKGGGAFLNGVPITVSTTTRLENSLLATGFPYDRKQSRVNNYDHFVNFQQSAQACRRPGAASLDLACTAAGRFDGYWEMKLKPWDVAAGQLLVREAGGQVTDFSGLSASIYGQEIVASNGCIHTSMLQILAQGTRP
jgi:myo-inositol-1(or 4)-monophosphatase